VSAAALKCGGGGWWPSLVGWGFRVVLVICVGVLAFVVAVVGRCGWEIWWIILLTGSVSGRSLLGVASVGEWAGLGIL